MTHRHLDDDVPASQRGLAAIDDLLERGDFADRRPLAKAIAAAPFGELAAQVSRRCDAHPMQGASSLWRAWIAARRAAGRSDRLLRAPLRERRQARHVTQDKLATQVGMSPSDRSKAERRSDLKLSTVRSLLEGLGLEPRLVAVDPDTGAAHEIAIP